MQILEGMMYVAITVALCAAALIINEDMAIMDRYQGADQYLSSLYP